MSCSMIEGLWVIYPGPPGFKRAPGGAGAWLVTRRGSPAAPLPLSSVPLGAAVASFLVLIKQPFENATS